MKVMIKSIFSVILSVLICLTAFVTVGTAVIKFKLMNTAHYTETVVTDEYVSALRDDVYENVSALCVNLEVHQDTVMSFVSDTELKRLSRANFNVVFSSLIEGVPLEYERFESAELKDEIYKELEAFANEAGIVDEDITEASELTYEYIIDDINSTLTYFTQDNMNSVSFVSRIPALNFIVNSAFFVALAVLAVLCVIKFLVMGRRSTLSYFYNVSFMLWLASACWFIPVTVIKLHNIAVNIAVAYSGFKVYLQNLINAVIDGFFDVSLWAFIISAVLLVASIVTIIVCGVVSSRRTADDEKND